MDESLRSMLQGTAALWVAVAAALFLTLSRPIPNPQPLARDRLLRLYMVAISLHCMHFLEEFLTGFHLRFPALLGLQAWTVEFFVTVNLACIALWSLSAAGIWSGLRLAYFPLWFLVIAMLANCAAHPAFALLTGGYFPGLATSPLMGWMGVVLWRKL